MDHYNKIKNNKRIERKKKQLQLQLGVRVNKREKKNSLAFLNDSLIFPMKYFKGKKYYTCKS